MEVKKIIKFSIWKKNVTMVKIVEDLEVVSVLIIIMD